MSTPFWRESAFPTLRSQAQSLELGRPRLLGRSSDWEGALV